MQSFLEWLKKQFLHMLPVVIFFFVAFCLADITRILTYKTTTAAYYSLLVIAVASLFMGKVVVISDHLPFISCFSNKPLIYSTLWKTLIYFVFSFFVRIVDRLVPCVVDHKSLIEIYQRMIEELSHPQFWIGFIWLGVLLLIFVAYRELIFAVGEDKVKELFFGK